MNIHPIITPASPSLASLPFDASFDSIESLTTTFVLPVVPTIETTTVTEVALGYHRNGQYSITAMTTSTGAVAERYAYTAYGQPTILNASGTVLTSSAVGNRYTYTGREWDETLGLHHFRARVYSPQAGRLTSVIPIFMRLGSSKVNNSLFAFPAPLIGGYALSTSDSGNCAWWLIQYTLDVREVDLKKEGLFDEWRKNIGKSLDDVLVSVIRKFNPTLSCHNQSGRVSNSSSGSGKINTQVTGVPLCSRIGPIGGSEVKYKWTCYSSANCNKCPTCFDVFSQEPNSVSGSWSCSVDFDLEDQFSNLGDFGDAHNKPKDLQGFHDCLDKCKYTTGVNYARCESFCRKEHLIGDLVPVVTDPFSGTYPYWIRAKWTESSGGDHEVDCGSRPQPSNELDDVIDSIF